MNSILIYNKRFIKSINIIKYNKNLIYLSILYYILISFRKNSIFKIKISNKYIINQNIIYLKNISINSNVRNITNSIFQFKKKIYIYIYIYINI